METNEPLYFNGIDPLTGDYLFEPQTPAQLATKITGIPLTDDEDSANHKAELEFKASQVRNAHLGTLAQDPTNLAETGWAVIFPFVQPDSEAWARQQAIADALAPLIDLRRAQAGKYFKLYRGPDGYRGPAGGRPPESKQKFLARHGAGPGPSDPEKVPYYLLLVASPDEIPFPIQYQLDVQYAVGRIHFDSVEDYAAYANSVVAAETGDLQLARSVASFAVANADDPATQLSAAYLMTPLFDKIAPRVPDWTITRYLPEQATKATLAGLLGGGDTTPAVLFTASHGLGLPKGDPLQRRHQGAILCQDWAGPVKWGRKPLLPDFYFSADDIAATADPHGAIVFNFACYGAGTPQFNDYGQRTGASEREAIADGPFVSSLHKRLLSLPRGGALACIGHVERAWGCSFTWSGAGGRGGSPSQTGVFEKAMTRLLTGAPIGYALETFNERYAELSSDLSLELEDVVNYGKKPDVLSLSDMWTANNDARGYAITGDPAVRVRVAPAGGPVRRVEVDRIVLRTADVVTKPEPAATPTPQPAQPTTPVQPAGGYSFAVPAAGPLTHAELARVFGSDGVLTVRTTVGDGDAPLAVSRYFFDGSLDNRLSAAAETSPAAMQLHGAALTHAQAHRLALLQALTAVAAGLRRP
jgi:hypothetical protein